MKICPNCSNVCKDTDDYCPECNKPIIEYDFEDDEDLFTPKVFVSNSNQDVELKKANVINDSPMSVINQQNIWKQSAAKQKQEENRRKKENVKFKIKTILWFVGLIVLNVLMQVAFYFYNNYQWSEKFKFQWGLLFWVSVLYCIFSLIASASSDIAKNPEKYEAINKAKQEAQQKRIAELKRQAEEDKKYIPKCPTCGSTNVRPISGLNRAGSMFMWGIMSSKIGKTYECLNCKYKW